MIAVARFSVFEYYKLTCRPRARSRPIMPVANVASLTAFGPLPIRPSDPVSPVTPEVHRDYPAR